MDQLQLAKFQKKKVFDWTFNENYSDIQKTELNTLTDQMKTLLLNQRSWDQRALSLYVYFAMIFLDDQRIIFKNVLHNIHKHYSEI